MSDHPYDPELPFLAELEHKVTARAREQSERDRAPRPRSIPSFLRDPLQPRTTRIARRIVTLTALLCLLAATALGARAVFEGRSHGQTAQSEPVMIEQGTTGTDTWTLYLYSREGLLCRELLLLKQEESSRCAPTPAPSQIGVSNVMSILHRYVFGVAGHAVSAVRLRTGTSTAELDTHPLPSAAAAALGASSDLRYFVGTVERQLGGPDPPTVAQALDRAGRQVGDPQTVCVRETASCDS